MHPSQISPFRKTIIVLVELVFTGSLLIFTGMANLDLLKSVYPDPKFYMFGLIALEGGVVAWFAFYLLHASGVHKAICIFALGIDALISGTGFFYELEATSKSVGTLNLPPIILIVAFAVVFNVAMGLIMRLIPSTGTPQEQPKAIPPQEYSQGYQPQRLAQEATTGPKVTLRERITDAAAVAAAIGQDVTELAQEKRRKKSVTSPIVTESIDSVTENEGVTEQKKA